MNENKRTNPLMPVLKFVLFLAIVVLPTMSAILNQEYEDLVAPMLLIGLWLILAGRLEFGPIYLEGKQAFSVGGALLLPVAIQIMVDRLGLWPPLGIGALVIGAVAAVILFFVIKPTQVSKDRTMAVVVFSVGGGLLIVGSALGDTPDGAGVILVNGIPLLPVPSMIALMQFLGLAGLLVGLYGLIFGFEKKPKLR